MAHAFIPPTKAPFTHDNPRVQVFPSARGTVHIVGVTRSGNWVAEYICRLEAYSAQRITEMERDVLAAEAREPGPRLVTSG